MKAARKDHERSDESEGEDDQEYLPDLGPGATAGVLALAESSRCFHRHNYDNIPRSSRQRQLVFRKDPQATGFGHQKVDGKSNQYQKHYVCGCQCGDRELAVGHHRAHCL